ncbi:MAG TPA: protein kinase, partial [Polyangiales bacterium]|nr:protein kinase [Polyangiales bacterium]
MIVEMEDPQPRSDESAVADRYAIETVLGRGGMATVYRVLDHRTGRKLALKRTTAKDGSRARRHRLLLEREYHTLAQLAHPRIIEVYDYGLDASGPYYTMELLEGRELSDAGRMPWREVCSLLIDVASSLAILHSRGMIHRDVSARNVRYGADGRAKLIDFGAMTSVGVAKDVVGTPPFMAPEVLQMQAPDARVDLFSLGALGYYLLTGRQAYPARKISDLRDVWRSAVVPPARVVPDTPAALSALIVELLRLDRSGRPQSAAEVMQRLASIAGMPPDEHVATSRAYLSMPVLVGRERALIAIRKRLLGLVRGDGGCVLVEGVSGSGRSRLLDASVFEAKLLGAAVVRADAGDAALGEWGVARALGAQLIALMPERAKTAARVSRDLLGHVLDGVGPEADSTSGPPPERSVLIRALREFVLALSRSQRLVIAVDDVDRIDEPSAALLAALAHKADRYPLMLSLAIDSESSSLLSPSLRVLRASSQAIACAHLSVEQSEALVRSVFGDVPNLPLCAGRIHALSHGSPRATMELAQHLVDRRLARYAGGAWVLPSQLADDDLPSSLAASLARRVGDLGPDALELADVLCLADGDALTLSDFAALTAHREPTRVFRALDELIATRVLIADADHYTFAQRGFVAVLDELMPDPRRRELHGRIGDFLADAGANANRRAHHLMRSGREREAVALLAASDLAQCWPPLPLLLSAVECAERLGAPARTLHLLRTAVLSKAAMLLEVHAFNRFFPAVLAQLEHDSGLALYRELADEPEATRLTTALTRTQERYLAASEHERVYGLVDAIRELARLAGAFCTLGMSSFNVELLDSLPSFEPLRPLSPALGVIEQIVVAGKDYISGRGLRSQRLYHELLARISEPDHAGLEPTHYERTRLGIHYVLGLIEACMGTPAAETHAAALDENPELRVNGWRVRVILHLTQGNSAEARKALRRAELLQLQHSGEQRYPGTTTASELIACALAGDLPGVNSAVDTLTALCERHPGWFPTLHYGQSCQLRLQGDPQRALDLVTTALDQVTPGQHVFFAYLAASRIELLSELGREHEAVACGRAYLELCQREQVETLHRSVQVALALALARAGEHAEAV